jgi:hypothetical protein
MSKSDDLGDMVWSQCIYCRHLIGNAKCAAFPEGIPQDILYNWHDHLIPYPGDKGVTFEPNPRAKVPPVQPLFPRPS